MNELTHLSLFSGIGGIDLAAEWAGFTTVAFCENDSFCQQVLNLRWPGVPICEDIHDMGRAWLDEMGLMENPEFARTGCDREAFGDERRATSETGRKDIRQKNGKAGATFLDSTGEHGRTERTGNRPTSAITLISGGFPCQPFSVAGKRRGKEDDRYLWPEMLRVISEVRPTWCCCENVAHFANMGLDEAISDLEGLSYQVQAFSIPACAVDAPHLRQRVFIAAHDNRQGELQQGGVEQKEWGWPRDGGQDVADASGEGLQDGDAREDRSRAYLQPSREGGRREGRSRPAQSRLGKCNDGISPLVDGFRQAWADGSWEDGIPRVATGVKDRVNRLKALGNAVVPAQVYPILKDIAEIEGRVSDG